MVIGLLREGYHYTKVATNGHDANKKKHDSVVLVLSVGVEFGKVGADGSPAAVKYAGCGKVTKAG